MTEIYACHAVQEVQRIHKPIISHAVPYETVREQLFLMVENLYQHYKAGDPAIVYELSNHHPPSIGQPNEMILNQSLKKFDFELTIAREFGFKNWLEVEKLGNLKLDITFEEAVNALIFGDFEKLQSLIIKKPQLLHQSSQYGHKAGLIHYVAANGVELWRQQIPQNLIAATNWLIEQGADPQMESTIYGGGAKVIGLIESSAHPYDAGIGEELAAIFYKKRQV